MFSLGGAAQQNKPGGLFGNTNTAGAATNTTSAPASGGLFGATSNSTPAQSSGTSLFGNFGNKPAETSGAAQTSGTATGTSGGTSLFGNSAGNQQQQTTTNNTGGSSLFGGFGGSQQQNAGSTGGSSLFGATQPAQSTTTGGLGGLGGATSQPGQASSLFGGLGGQQQNATQPAQHAFGGLGGGQQQSQAQQAGGMFGKLQPAASTSQVQPSGQSKGPQAEHAQKTEPQIAYFGQLLERGKKRQNVQIHNSSPSQLPSLQLGLGDISRKLRNLGESTPTKTQRGQARDSHSHYLLAASGVNTAAALRDLSALGAEVGVKPAAQSDQYVAPFDTDLDGYVENLYRQSSLDLVEHHLNQARKDFDDFLEDHVQMEWDTQRQRIYEHFGLTKKGDQDEGEFDAAASIGNRGTFGRSSRRSRLGATLTGPGASTMNKSVLGIPSMRGSRAPGFNDVAEKTSSTNFQPAPEDRLLREKQDRYAEKVKTLNAARLDESVYPILHHFADVEAQPSAEDTSHYVNCFKALAEMVGEKDSSLPFSEPGAIKERHYASDYADDAPNSKGAFELRKRILNGSRVFLEKQFLANLETAVIKNPREANLGGIPSVTNKVRAYIRLRSARKELGSDNVFLQQVGDDYAWVLVFYLLRAGLTGEATEYVQTQSTFFAKGDRNFITALKRYAESEDRRPTPAQQELVSKDYASKIYNQGGDSQVDPYRAACYKIIGRLGLGKRNLENINQSMEDWVWLQFALAREVNRVEEAASEVFGLEDVRSVIHEIGQRHFLQGQAEGASAYGTYFFLQILAGQFESAIAWLYPNNYLTAVHFALALNYYGLLRVNDFNGSDDLLSYTTRQQPQLAFGHMVGFYTRDFRSASPTNAADYLSLIALNADGSGDLGTRQLGLCHEALRELVLETREFAQLLGDIRFDGQRIKGAIEKRLPLIRITDSTQFLREITIGAAQIADEKGRVTDAVLLYHLAEEYDDVVSVCARALSDAVAAAEGDVIARLEPLKPRDVQQQTQQPNNGAAPPNASLSLTAVTAPHDLAATMLGLYKANALLLQKIRPANRAQLELLLRISAAKDLFLARKWVLCLDAVEATGMLPTAAEGDMAVIRAKAHAFDGLPALVVRLGGDLLIWTIRCVAGQRGVLEQEGWGAERRVQIERLGAVARDCMVFAGMVRYRLGSRVWDALGGEGLDA